MLAYYTSDGLSTARSEATNALVKKTQRISATGSATSRTTGCASHCTAARPPGTINPPRDYEGALPTSWRRPGLRHRHAAAVPQQVRRLTLASRREQTPDFRGYLIWSDLTGPISISERQNRKVDKAGATKPWITLAIWPGCRIPGLQANPNIPRVDTTKWTGGPVDNHKLRRKIEQSKMAQQNHTPDSIRDAINRSKRRGYEEQLRKNRRQAARRNSGKHPRTVTNQIYTLIGLGILSLILFYGCAETTSGAF